MRTSRIIHAAIPALALAFGTPAVAGLSQAVIVPPGGFIQAGAYAANPCACGSFPGVDIESIYGPAADLHEQSFPGPGWAQQSASYSSGLISNSASGTAGMGLIRLAASNTSPSTTFFSMGVVNGGWKETFTISHPALDGQDGFMVFRIRARGTMQTTGITGATALYVAPYKDGAVPAKNALFDSGNSDGLSTGLQYVRWSLASYGTPDSLAVDGTATMAVPMTFGQPFTLGIYALATAGQRSSGGFGTLSDAILDFSGSGVEWAGITSVQSAGGPISGYAVVSGTGKDWGVAFDADGDGAANQADCAPFDPGAFAAPGEVAGDAVSADGATYSWAPVASLAGSGTVYDVARGALGELPVGSGATESCLATDLQASSVTDGDTPPTGGGFYYVVRARNACGTGTYGHASSGAERITTACP